MSLLHGRFRVRSEKQIDDGTRVVLCQNANGGWHVGRAGDPALDPYPLGEFASEEAARRYADQRFPGGSWRAAPRRARYP